MEFQYIPSFTITKSLLDMKPYLPKDFLSKYPEWIQKQIDLQNGIYGVPWDTGPLGFIYRKDLLDKAGVKTPIKTWDDFAAAAIKYHKANPKSYLVEPARRPDGPVARAVLAERRAAVHVGPEERQGRPHRPEDQAGHRVLGQALRRRRHLA